MEADKEKRRKDIDAEAAVLGSMLLNGKAVDRVRAIVTEADFAFPQHRSIFGVIIKVSDRGGKADALAVAEELVQSGEFDCAYLEQYLIRLLESAGCWDNAEVYARLVWQSNELRD